MMERRGFCTLDELRQVADHGVKVRGRRVVLVYRSIEEMLAGAFEAMFLG